MQSFIVIRDYRDDDMLKCQELVRDYVMSFAKKSFYSFCFKEITLQLIVITWAILFIFLGVPLTFCALTIPGCVIFIFSATYFSFYAKAMELMRTKPNQCLVAECYEPFLMRCKPNEASYEIFMNDAPYDASFKNKFRKKIIGTISVKNHSTLYSAAWIYRFAIDPNYPFNTLGEPMLNLVKKNCNTSGYRTLECSISEWQEDARDFFDNMGFATRQIYHKQIIGSSLCVMKSQLTLELKNDPEKHVHVNKLKD